jgi:hypothetical protein
MRQHLLKWLLLKDTKGLSQGSIDTVYRLETAGGNKPTTCKGQKSSFEVKYSAQCKYPNHSPKTCDSNSILDWIYGPKASGYGVST